MLAHAGTSRLGPHSSAALPSLQAAAAPLPHASARWPLQTLTHVTVLVQVFEEVLGSGRLRGARLTNQNNGLLNLNHPLQHPGGAGCVHCVNCGTDCGWEHQKRQRGALSNGSFTEAHSPIKSVSKNLTCDPKNVYMGPGQSGSAVKASACGRKRHGSDSGQVLKFHHFLRIGVPPSVRASTGHLLCENTRPLWDPEACV